MKKAFLLFSLIGLTGYSFAQTGTMFGVKAGLNLSSLTASTGGSSSTKTGFHVGAIADVDLGSNFSIQPGVFYILKGGSEEVTLTSGSSSFHAKEDVTLNYLEVPVNILYNVPVSFGKIYVGAGPYIALGISGNDKVSSSSTGGSSSSSSSSESKVTFGSGTGDVKNPDYGVNFLGGVKLESGLLFGIGYGLGLANLNNDSSSGSTKNASFSVSVGFMFK